jgi:hypothetical protein
MNFTLVFVIYNKEKWVESILESWLTNCSDIRKLEVIIVFDDLKDNSENLARNVISKFNVKHKFLYADDKHEIFCNNLALLNASHEKIIFIQDDNWIYDRNWDLVIENTYSNLSNIGAIAFLAGAQVANFSFYKDVIIRNYLIFKHNLTSFFDKKSKSIKFGIGFRFDRIETDREHKKENFSNFQIKSQESGIWRVHFITRPFCIDRKLLLSYDGLDKNFMPHWGDDIDLCFKLIKNGFQNLYVSFDLLNISTVSDNKKHGNLNVLINNRITYLYLRHRKLFKLLNKIKLKKVSTFNK